ncbi:hypothetical protein [Arenibacter sp. GZD-96]|nr:hypothetical protein [Arenibacter sp. GZD-96]
MDKLKLPELVQGKGTPQEQPGHAPGFCAQDNGEHRNHGKVPRHRI